MTYIDRWSEQEDYRSYSIREYDPPEEDWEDEDNEDDEGWYNEDYV